MYRNKMYRAVQLAALMFVVLAVIQTSAAQSNYQVVPVSNPGTISGTVKWSGPEPHALTFPVTKDPQICDPDSRKRVDLERLIIGPQGGVANTVVFLKEITKGKAMDIPEPRRFLNQSHCRYEPHILLVPREALLKMKSSDATLHTIHMDGAATYNLPFPFPNQVISRSMNNSGLVNLKCNGGHVWMNAEAFVVDHPYYAVTDETGKFEISDVPPGEYELVAWHEGWKLLRQENAVDVLTEKTVQRPIFSDPRTWDKHISVHPGDTTVVNFSIADK